MLHRYRASPVPQGVLFVPGPELTTGRRMITFYSVICRTSPTASAAAVNPFTSLIAGKGAESSQCSPLNILSIVDRQNEMLVNLNRLRLFRVLRAASVLEIQGSLAGASSGERAGRLASIFGKTLKLSYRPRLSLDNRIANSSRTHLFMGKKVYLRRPGRTR